MNPSNTESCSPFSSRAEDDNTTDSSQQPAPQQETIRLLIPKTHVGRVIGRSGKNKVMLRKRHNLTTSWDRKCGVEGMSEFIMSGTAGSLEAAKLDIIRIFTLARVPHEHFSQEWPVAGKKQSQPTPPDRIQKEAIQKEEESRKRRLEGENDSLHKHPKLGINEEDRP